jgi:hypothetical protein
MKFCSTKEVFTKDAALTVFLQTDTSFLITSPFTPIETRRQYIAERGNSILCDKNTKYFEKAKESQRHDRQRQFGSDKAFVAQKPNSNASTEEKKSTCNSSKIPKATQYKKTPLRVWGMRWVRVGRSTVLLKETAVIP